jgi:hypothetical protein
MAVQTGAFMAQEQYMIKRVPANIETAALTLTANATQQDWPIITALNTALATAVKTQLATDKAYMLYGTLEIVNDGNGARTSTIGNGGTTDGDDTEWVETDAGAATSYFYKMSGITTDTLNIKVKIDDKDHATLIFHLEAYQEIQPAAE